MAENTTGAAEPLSDDLCDAYGVPRGSTRDEVADGPLRSGILVGDTRFEGWLSEHAITDVRGSKVPVYHKQDMRDAYAAGHEEGWRDGRATKLMESGQTGTDGSQKPNDADAIRSAKAGSIYSGRDPAEPRDDSDRSYSKPIGYVAATELSRLHSGHNADLRSARFGPSPLDGDIPVYIDQPAVHPSPAPQASMPPMTCSRSNRSYCAMFDTSPPDMTPEWVKLSDEIEASPPCGGVAPAPQAEAAVPGTVDEILEWIERMTDDAPIRNMAKAARERLAAEAAVPVAKQPDSAIREWADRHDLRGGLTELRDIFEDAQTLHLAGAPQQPAAPAAPAEGVRMPLTTERIDELWGDFMSAQGSGHVPDFVRAIEREHGIATIPATGMAATDKPVTGDT